MADTVILDTLIRRLKKIGIDIQCYGNYPWIYLDTVNGNKVEEQFLGNHGFSVAFLPLRGEKMKLADITFIFDVIRKYKDKI